MESNLEMVNEKTRVVDDPNLLSFIKQLSIIARSRSGQDWIKTFKIRDREWALIQIIENFKTYEDSSILIEFLSGYHAADFSTPGVISYNHSFRAVYLNVFKRLSSCSIKCWLSQGYLFVATHKLIFRLLQNFIKNSDFILICKVMQIFSTLSEGTNGFISSAQFYGLRFKFLAHITKFYLNHQNEEHADDIIPIICELIDFIKPNSIEMEKLIFAQERILALFIKNCNNYDQCKNILEKIFHCSFNKSYIRKTTDKKEIIKSVKRYKKNYNYNIWPIIEYLYFTVLDRRHDILAKMLVHKSNNKLLINSYVQSLASSHRIFRAYYRINNKMFHEKIEKYIEENISNKFEHLVHYIMKSPKVEVCVYYPCLYFVTKICTSSLDVKLFSILFFRAIESGAPMYQDIVLKALTKLKNRTDIKEILYYREEQCQGGYTKFFDNRIVGLAANKDYVINPITYIQPSVLTKIARKGNYDWKKNKKLNENIIFIMLDKLERFPILFRNIFLLQMLKRSNKPELTEQLLNIVEKIIASGQFHNLLKSNAIVQHYYMRAPSFSLSRLLPLLSKTKTKSFKSEYFGFNKKKIQSLFVFDPKFVNFATKKSFDSLKSICNTFTRLIINKGKPISIDEFIQKFYVIDFTLTKIVNLFFQIYKDKMQISSNDYKKINETKEKFEEAIGHFNTLIKLYHFYILLNSYIIATNPRKSPFIEIPKNWWNSGYYSQGKLVNALDPFREYYSQIYCPNLMNSILLKVYIDIHNETGLVHHRFKTLLAYLKENPSFNMSNVMAVTKSLNTIKGEISPLSEFFKENGFEFTLANNDLLDKEEFINFDIQDYERLILNPNIEIKKQEEQDA